MPGSTPDTIRTYYRGSARAARFNVGCQALSLVAQAGYVAAMARLAARHRAHPRSLRFAVLTAGGAGLAALAASATIQAGLTIPRERGDAEVLSATRRVFVTGGPVHGVANGVLTAATVAAARDAGLLGIGGVGWGAGSAAANLAAPAYFRWEAAGWLIPIGRFSAYALSGVVGVRLAWRNRTAGDPRRR